MAYTNGTAANYKDLLAALATFASANGWIIKEQSTDSLYLKGIGLDGLDEIYVGVSTYEDAPNNRYNWSMVGSWGWTSGRAFGYHPKTSNYRNSNASYQVVAYMWNASIPYWIVCNSRRIILVAKIGTTYQHVHLGFINTPATDAQYPYPLFIGGTGNTLSANYSALNQSYWNGLPYFGARLSFPGGQWGSNTSSTSEACPTFLVRSANEIDRTFMLTAMDGSYLLETLYIYALQQVGILGTFEGLYRVTGYNNTAENIITVSGVNYMVFPDCEKSGFGDYVAMRLN